VTSDSADPASRTLTVLRIGSGHKGEAIRAWPAGDRDWPEAEGVRDWREGGRGPRLSEVEGARDWPEGGRIRRRGEKGFGTLASEGSIQPVNQIKWAAEYASRFTLTMVSYVLVYQLLLYHP
jgi:hypothetical protein